ncbi:MAG: hypothetical protein F4Y18_05580 [Cenarchaeum sp. SB0663_bin_5]|nr:hypothetical protein [Cenarchaeum sp. SB0663_bin_5]MYH04204.1 hypothetical protein [Cenarchaeum sp. SB0675_bin_21]MYL11841.1 hypothetical protein [Cenarchaeum sp. SB0669_bin_11]
MKEFSIMFPFRDTPLERKFAEKLLPSAIELNPDELVIGVDSPAGPSFIDLILNLYQPFKDVNIVQVPHSDEWNFPLANVLWSCFKEYRNDVVLAGNIDTILKPVLLQSLDCIGQNNNLGMSFPIRSLTRNLNEWIRYLFELWAIRRKYFWIGTFWLYLQYVYEDVDKKGMDELSNGVDIYMEEYIINPGRYKIITTRKHGAQSLHLGNPDYPWRQFEWGHGSVSTWMSKRKNEYNVFRSMFDVKNITTMAKVEKEKRIQRSQGRKFSRLLTHVIHRFLILLVLKLSFIRQHKWRLQDWMWARKNSTYIAVTKDRGVPYIVYSYDGAKYIRDMYDWKKHGVTRG